MELPDHRIAATLREIPGQRWVGRTFVRGRNCVSRILLSDRVDPSLSAAVEQLVMTGRGNVSVPRSIDITLSSYRAAAALPRKPDSPWTFAVAAGVNREGFVYISTRWIEGRSLFENYRSLTSRMRQDVAKDAAYILMQLHSQHLAYGDFKAENLIIAQGDREIPAGRLVLIDLDTLRPVPGQTEWSPTRDLTRSWAAPEQTELQRTYLSSDLYAFARLISEMYGEELPFEWREWVEACRLPDPLRRPQTHLIWQRLCGQRPPLLDWEGHPTPPSQPLPAPETTERLIEAPFVPPPAPVPAPVPIPLLVEPEIEEEQDSESISEPVDVPVSIPEPVVIAETFPLDPVPVQVQLAPKPARGRGCLMGFMALASVPLILCLGSVGWWMHQQQLNADSAADVALSAMKAYKTDSDLNSDSGQRKYIRDLAETAWEIQHTTHSGAVRALAVVWSQGWQDSGRSWNAGRFEEGQAAIDDVSGNAPEKLLAQGSLDAAACKLRTDNESAEFCQSSLKNIAQFYTALPNETDTHWLRLEGAWIDITVRARLFMRATQAQSPDAQDHARRGLERCAASEALLEFAPVNGPEMMEDCLALAGSAGNLDVWFHTADLLLTHSSSSTTIKQLYTAAGSGCEKTEFRKGTPRPEPSSKADPWCASMGYAAQDSWFLAVRWFESPHSDGHPWEALERYLRQHAAQEFVMYDHAASLGTGGN